MDTAMTSFEGLDAFSARKASLGGRWRDRVCFNTDTEVCALVTNTDARPLVPARGPSLCSPGKGPLPTARSELSEAPYLLQTNGKGHPGSCFVS